MAVWVLDHNGTVFVVDPATVAIVAQAETGRGRGASMAIGEQAIWVASYEGASVTRLHPETLRVERVVDVVERPVFVVAGLGGVWVTLQVFGGGLAKIDPATNIASRLNYEGMPKAASHGVLWIDQHRGFDTSALLQFDPETKDTIEIGEFENMGWVVPDDQGVWIPHDLGRDCAVSRIDPGASRVVQTVLLPRAVLPSALTVVDGEPIVATFPRPKEGTTAPPRTHNLLRIEPSSGDVVKSLALDDYYSLVAGYGAIWACAARRGQVLRIDPTELAITDRIEVGGELREIHVEHQ